MMNKILCTLISIFAFGGCADHKELVLVGGPCEYKTYQGTANLIRVEDGYMSGIYIFKPHIAFSEEIKYLENRSISGNIPKHPIVGKNYKANLQVITKGTCTPWIIEIKE